MKAEKGKTRDFQYEHTGNKKKSTGRNILKYELLIKGRISKIFLVMKLWK